MQRFRASMVILGMFGHLIAASAVHAVSNSRLTVTLEGVSKPQGQICLSLFASGQGFPDQGDRALQSQCVKATDTPLAVTFKDLKAGSYAVAVFHDVNSDGKLNRNALGIPTEGFGFSRNPKIVAGPPKFGDTVFLIAGSSNTIQIRLMYFLG